MRPARPGASGAAGAGRRGLPTGASPATAPDARPYVRMIIERLFTTLPVLSHVEIAKGVEIKVLGTIS